MGQRQDDEYDYLFKGTICGVPETLCLHVRGDVVPDASSMVPCLVSAVLLPVPSVS